MIDASRFLAQSQSRLSFRQPDETPRNPLGGMRRADQNASRLNSRLFPRPMGQGSMFSQAPFSRNTHQAPLFLSATEDFHEDDEEEEHEREVADFYALQRSRRQGGMKRMTDSSEVEDNQSQNSSAYDADEVTQQRGIKSPWKGGASGASKVQQGRQSPLQESSQGSHMFDVGLESTMRSETDEDEPPEELTLQSPKPVSRRRDPYETVDDLTQQGDPTADPVPPGVSQSIDPPKYDAFWSNLYLICLVSLLSSFILIYLHTENPRNPLGDTVYSTLHSSFFLLAVDTIIAVLLSLLWIAVLKSYVRILVYIMLISVPVVLVSFSIYPFVSSFQGTTKSPTIQDQAMRWMSTLPGFLAAAWVYGVFRNRQAFGKAIGILEFACKILAANPGLLILGYATLASTVIWTWLWMGMFTRVFLEGKLVGRLFIIDVGTWWLGAFFVLVYLWTLGVESGIQRATTAATVSQWYFHRFNQPAPSSTQVIRAALAHAVSTSFGTICFSTLLTLVARLPVLVLPKRWYAVIGFCSYTLLPNSVLTMTHPTTLTYAAIHSQSLANSARAVSQLVFMTPPDPGFRRKQSPPKTSTIPPYNISFLLLHATRLIASIGFGFGTWVTAARSLKINDTSAGIRGSLYAYIVGLIAGAIGWGVLGAMEGIITGIVDAVVVCWASEIRNGDIKYCREAGWLLGDGHEEHDDDDDREGLLGR